MEFGEQRTEGGIIIMSDDGKSMGIHPRWGKVLAVGPKTIRCPRLDSMYLLHMVVGVHGFKLNGETVRTVDPNDVLEYKMMNQKLFTKQVQVIKHKNIKEK